jgi:uracil-DNA glycosylase
MIRSQLADQPGGIFFLSGVPGNEDEIKGYPLVGSDGHLLARALRAGGLTDPTDVARGFLPDLLPEARRLLWERRAHSFSTVLDFQPPGNDLRSVCAPLKEAATWTDGSGLPSIRDAGCLRPEHHNQIRRLIRELLSCRPNIVVSLGDLALWALTGQCSTEEWRGAARRVAPNAPIMKLATAEDSLILSRLKILPTYPPDRVLQQYKLLGVLIADLMKVRHEGSHPELRPLEIAVWLEPELRDLEDFWTSHIQGADLLTIDIETAVGQIVCVQVGTSPTTALVLPFVDYRKPSRSYWGTEADELAAWQWLARVLDTEQPKSSLRPTGKLMQNGGAYDIFWLLDKAGLSVRNYRHDLRLVHHILQPELQKSLAFMGSMYTNMPKWKAQPHHGDKRFGTEDKRDS